MKKILATTLTMMVLTTLSTIPAWAKSTHFGVVSGGLTLNGVQLEPGEYDLKLNGGNEAQIWRVGKFSKKLILTAEVKLEPFKTRHVEVVSHAGAITEIRTGKQKVLFANSSD